MEAMLQLVIVIALASALLVFDPRIAELGQGFETLLILVAGLGLVLILPKVFNKLIGWVYKLLKRTSIPREKNAVHSSILVG